MNLLPHLAWYDLAGLAGVCATLLAFFLLQDGRLLAEQTVNGQRPSLDRLGPVDVRSGSFGRAVRWLAAVRGVPADSLSIGPGSPLNTVLNAPGTQAELLHMAMDSLGVDSATVQLRMSGVSDVSGLMRMIRAYGRKR